MDSFYSYYEDVYYINDYAVQLNSILHFEIEM